MIRCDNGPDYISQTTREWAKDRGIHIELIQPGNPQQNAYVERFKDGTLRVAQPISLGGMTPKQRLAMAA